MEEDAGGAVAVKPNKMKKKGLMASSIMASRAMAAGSQETAVHEPAEKVQGSDSEEEETVQLMNADLAGSYGEVKQQENVLPEQSLSEPSTGQVLETLAEKRTNGSTAKRKSKKAVSVTSAGSTASVSSSAGTNKRRQRGRGQRK